MVNKHLLENNIVQLWFLLKTVYLYKWHSALFSKKALRGKEAAKQRPMAFDKQTGFSTFANCNRASDEGGKRQHVIAVLMPNSNDPLV